MIPCTRRRTLDIAPDRFMAILTDVPSWPRTMPRVASVQMHTPGPLKVGTRFKLVRRRGEQEFPNEYEVTQLGPDRLAYFIDSDRERSGGRWVVRPSKQSPAKSDVALSITIRPRSIGWFFLMPLMLPFVWLMAGDELNAMERVLRGEPADPPAEPPAPSELEQLRAESDDADEPRKPAPELEMNVGIDSAVYDRTLEEWQFQVEMTMFAGCLMRPVALMELTEGQAPRPFPPASVHPTLWATVSLCQSPRKTPINDAQRRAFERLLRRQAEVERVALEGLLEYYRRVRTEIYDGASDTTDMPEISGIDEPRYLVRFSSLSIHRPGADGECEIGLWFNCTWEDEHALGIRLRAGRVIDVGYGDVATNDPEE
ncbi:MAG: SRPBCC family protein [Phycisphaerales bacterium]